METQQLTRYKPDAARGLTAEQVRARIDAGLVNVQPPHITKTYLQILRDNLCTFFNVLNFGIAICLLLVGSYQNMLFMGVVLCNLLIGTVQQIRAKRTVEKLSVLCAAHAQVLRDGVEEPLPLEALVLDDVIVLHLGAQIPADATLLSGEVEVNEALLTGEPDPIRKQPGDLLLSGSFVVSGACHARVEHIGKQNYALAIAQEARAYKKVRSELMRSLKSIVKFTGSAVLPLGALLFLRAHFAAGAVLRDSVVQTAAAMIGMIPSGLVLLTSVSLAVSVMTLARRNTLVQELYCIEQLSRVDMLCLDKTGTLTAGHMLVTDIQHAYPSRARENTALLAALLRALPADNATSSALHNAYAQTPAAHTGELLGTLPFSSSRKYSAASFSEIGTLYLGAPEMLCPALPAALSRALAQHQEQGSRVLLLAHDAQATDPHHAPDSPAPLSLIVLEDALRPEAADTLRFFRREGVTIKLISGDNPVTVAGIAKRLSLPGFDRFVDASTFSDDEALAEAASEYTIFGRVSPRQKRVLVRALKQQGHTVAMTGDGVNDVLALKDADCSVAMAAGSDAARQVAQLVLMDNSFASLPAVVLEGRRVINNITRTASLFLVKTIFSFLLTISAVLLGMPYPFEPVQLSLISMLTIGLPSFLLALEPNRSRITGRFFENVLTRALPGALLVFVYALIANLLGPLVGLNVDEINTLCVYLTGIAGVSVLFKVCLPFHPMRMLLCVIMAAGLLAGALFLRDILHIGLPAGRMWLLLLPMGALCYPALMGMAALASRISLRKALRNAEP